MGDAARGEAEERPAAAARRWCRGAGLGGPVLRGNTLELLRPGLEDLLSDVGVIHVSMY